MKNSAPCWPTPRRISEYHAERSGRTIVKRAKAAGWPESSSGSSAALDGRAIDTDEDSVGGDWEDCVQFASGVVAGAHHAILPQHRRGRGEGRTGGPHAARPRTRRRWRIRVPDQANHATTASRHRQVAERGRQIVGQDDAGVVVQAASRWRGSRVLVSERCDISKAFMSGGGMRRLGLDPGLPEDGRPPSSGATWTFSRVPWSGVWKNWTSLRLDHFDREPVGGRTCPTPRGTATSRAEGGIPLRLSGDGKEWVERPSHGVSRFSAHPRTRPSPARKDNAVAANNPLGDRAEPRRVGPPHVRGPTRRQQPLAHAARRGSSPRPVARRSARARLAPGPTRPSPSARPITSR